MLTWQQSDADMLRDRIVQVERKSDAVFISLTRTAVQNITTAGTFVTWQDLIDMSGFTTWSASTITIPMAGYYSASILGSLSVKDGISGDVFVNGVYVCAMGYGDHKDTYFRLNVVRFYKAGDVVRFRLTVTNGTRALQVVTEDDAGESPILHMVQI
jgi:hypothetical protein